MMKIGFNNALNIWAEGNQNLKGRSLFIYELKRLELKAPATGQTGEKLDLKWQSGQEKAQATQSIALERHHSRSRTQGEDR